MKTSTPDALFFTSTTPPTNRYMPLTSNDCDIPTLFADTQDAEVRRSPSHCSWDAERPGMHSFAARWNDRKDQKIAGFASCYGEAASVRLAVNP